MVHLYHGDGKGKTTAAVRLAVRMVGTGGHVFIVQFLKGQPSGEVRALLRMQDVTLLRGRPDEKFVFQMTDEEKQAVCALQTRQINLAEDAVLRGEAQMIVLDEALDAVATGTLAEDALLDTVRACEGKAEVVLTGRNPSEKLLNCADYVTHMRKQKHPFDRGEAARRGIEY